MLLLFRLNKNVNNVLNKLIYDINVWNFYYY